MSTKARDESMRMSKKRRMKLDRVVEDKSLSGPEKDMLIAQMTDDA